jgi:cysteine desulfurase/selenocysteine lyase
MYDIRELRAEFPILSRVLPNGKPLVYFDNAATSQKPNVVIDAMSRYYKTYNSNAHRGAHTLADEATTALEAARQSIASFFGASPSNLIYTSGTTEAINLVAYAWARRNLSEGDAVVLTEMEHHADIVPWQELSKEIGIELRFVPLDLEHMCLDMGAYRHALQGAALVCVVHTSNVLGIRNPIEEIITLAKESGARILIDAAQGAAHERINFKELEADFVTLSAHKMAGPTGIGALLATNEALSQCGPFLTGGQMIQSVSTDGSIFRDGAALLETGTPRIAEAIGWGAAIDWLSKIDFNQMHDHIKDLAIMAFEGMSQIDGITIYSDPTRPGSSGTISFLHERIASDDLAMLLDEGGFALRTGQHCAQPLMDALGVASTNRISLWLYNTEEEVKSFLSYLRMICERFGQ